MPMGVASMSLTWAMPAASTVRMCAGSGLPLIFASSAGIRLSSTMVVLPEPDTPVTTVSRPLGISTSKGFTVWTRFVDRWILPFAKRSSFSAQARSLLSAAPERNGPIDQKGRFERQVAERKAVEPDCKAQVDYDYVMSTLWSTVCPPTGGLVFGVDRLVMLLTDSASIRDVLLSPR